MMVKQLQQTLFHKIEDISIMMMRSIIKLVEIESVKSDPLPGKPYGQGIANALNEALSIARSLGFQTKNIDGYMGYAQYGDGDDYIGIIGHLDVVQATGNWSHPPFQAYVNAQGCMFARGILDNKGPLMCCLYALYAVKELQLSIMKPIRILFGTNEESGFQDVVYYLKKEKPPILGWTPDCKYPVVYGERGRAVLQFLSNHEHTNELFSFINTFILNDISGERLGINYADHEFGKLQMYGYELITKKDQIGCQITLSYPACVTIDELIEQINLHKPNQIQLILTLHYHPICFDKDSFLIKTLQNAYEVVSELDGTPVTTTGSTYAKLMPNIVPFGPSFPGQKGIGHKPDEWMNIKDLIVNAKIYALAMYELANGDAKHEYTS